MNNYAFFQMSGRHAKDNLTCFLYAREYFVFGITKARFQMEAVLIQSVMYCMIFALWMVVKFIQHDYDTQSSMNWIALFDTIVVFYFGLYQGMKICLTLNNFFAEERSKLTEIRKDIFVDEVMYGETVATPHSRHIYAHLYPSLTRALSG